MKQLLVVGFTLVALIGCGGGGGGGDAGPAADGATPDGGGTAEVNGGAPDTGGAETPVPPSDAGGGGDSAPVAALDDLGKPQLTGMDGITGTVNGKTYAYFRNAKATDYGTEYKSLQMKADAPTGSGDAWTITIPKKTGTFPCGRNGDAENGMIALVGGPANLGTAHGVAGSGCTVEVKSVVGHIEGRFVANLVGFLGSQNLVTSGCFSFARGLADCANAKDPGLAPGADGATLAISKVTGGEVYFRCGDNLTVAPLSANPLQPYLSGKAAGTTATSTCRSRTWRERGLVPHQRLPVRRHRRGGDLFGHPLELLYRAAPRDHVQRHFPHRPHAPSLTPRSPSLLRCSVFRPTEQRH